MKRLMCIAFALILSGCFPAISPPDISSLSDDLDEVALQYTEAKNQLLLIRETIPEGTWRELESLDKALVSAYFEAKKALTFDEGGNLGDALDTVATVLEAALPLLSPYIKDRDIKTGLAAASIVAGAWTQPKRPWPGRYRAPEID